MIRELSPNLNVRYRGIRLLLKLIFTTAFFLMHVAFAIWGPQAHIERIKTRVKGYFAFTHYTGNLITAFPVISALCLFLNRNKLYKIEHDIIMISELFGIPKILGNSKRLHYVFLLVLFLEILYESLYEGYSMLVTSSVYSYYGSIFLKWLVLREFLDRFSVLRSYYRQLSELLNVPWAQKEELVQSHEVLGYCCSTLWECYVVQMTIYVINGFALAVSYIYLVVDSFSRCETFTTYHLVYIFWITLYSFLIWLIVYSCAETKNSVRLFYYYYNYIIY